MANANPAAASQPVLCFSGLICLPGITNARATLGRGYNILLKFQIVQQIEIRIQIVILIQRLQIAYRGAGPFRLRDRRS